MENIAQKIEEKESEILTKIEALKKHEELGPMIMKGSCTKCKCNVGRTTDLAKFQLHDMMSYFVNLHELVLEEVKKETLSELGEFLCLYADKQELQQHATMR